MGDSDKEFKISIVTTTDTGGVTQTTAALQTLTTAQKEMLVSSGVSTSYIEENEAALALQMAALKGDTAATDENTAAHALNSVAMREMMVVSRELERGNLSRLPGSLSILLSQFVTMTPEITIGLIAASVAGMGLYEWMKKSREEMEKLREAQAQFDTAVFENQAAALARVTEIGQKYADLLDKLKDKTDALRDAEQLRNTILEATASANERIFAAEEEAEMATAIHDPAKQIQIRLKYDMLRAEAVAAAEQSKVAQDKQSVTDAHLSLTVAQANAAQATAAAQTFAGNKPRSVAEAESRGEQTKKDADDAEAAFLKATGASSVNEAMGNLKLYQQNYQDALKRAGGNKDQVPLAYTESADTAENAYIAWQRSLQAITSNQKAIDDWNARLTALTAAATEAQNKLSQASGDLNTANQKYSQSSATLGVDQAAAAIIASIQRGVTPDAIAGAAGAYGSAASGHPLTGAQAQMITALKAVLDQAHANTLQILQMLATMAANGNTVQSIIAAVSAQVANTPQLNR